MAMSRQVALSCQLCEEHKSLVGWKCLDCDAFICERCKQIHQRSKALKDHNVIKTSDLHNEETKNKLKVRLRNTTCTQHSSEFCLYCFGCKKLVCAKCVSSEHKQHDLHDFNTIFEERSCELNDCISDIDKINEIIVSKEIEVDKIQNEKLKTYQNTKATVIKRQKDIVSSVNDIEQKILQELENNHKTSQLLIQESREDIQSLKSKVLQRKQTTEHALRTYFLDDVLACPGDSGKLLKSVKRIGDVQSLSDLSFKHPDDETTSKQLQSVFGSFGGRLRQDKNVSPKFVPMETFVTPVLYINSLKVVADKTLWIVCESNQLLMKMSFDKQPKKLQRVSGSIFEFDFMLDGNCIAVYGYPFKNDVYKFSSKDKKFYEFIHLTPLYPRSLAVTKSGEILVGVFEMFGEDFYTKQNRIRQVRRFSSSGELRKIYECDNNDKKCLAEPWRIRMIENDKFCVIDRTAEKQGDVVCFKIEGRYLWRFKGPEALNLENPFCPTGLAETPKGNIVISDLYNHLLIVLNNLGNVLTKTWSANLGVCYPLSLVFDKQGTLWIGGSIAVDSENQKGQLHAIRFTEEL